jgi:hypothetical protein
MSSLFVATAGGRKTSNPRYGVVSDGASHHLSKGLKLVNLGIAPIANAGANLLE